VGRKHDLPWRNHGNPTAPNLTGRVSACLGTSLALSAVSSGSADFKGAPNGWDPLAHQHVVFQPGKESLRSSAPHPPKRVLEAGEVENDCIGTGLVDSCFSTDNAVWKVPGKDFYKGKALRSFLLVLSQ